MSNTASNANTSKDAPLCTLCNQRMVVEGKKVIGDSEYILWKCEHCHRTIAKLKE